jgi:quinoprotein glucose dehydrogenase
MTTDARLRCGLAIAFLLLGTAAGAADGWPHYGGDEGGTHYSNLGQINRDNVARLQLAWSFQTGELAQHPDLKAIASLNTTPLFLAEPAGPSLVFCTAFNRIIALDPATGKERWRFDPGVDQGPRQPRYNCRGIAYWPDPQANPDAACAHRLFMGTTDLRLIAIDARSGKRCEDFGARGEIKVLDLVMAEIETKAQLTGRPAAFKTGDIQFVSPPVIVSDTVIVGSTNNTKFRRIDGPSGAVRAFDARSGAAKWTFDPVPRNAGDPQAANWTAAALAATGAANVWSFMSVDSARGLVFLPTASAAPDFFGGTRPGDNRYANSVVALKAATGEVAWHYQIVHHDVWDIDMPAQPMLLDLPRDGRKIPAVVQLTKMGMIFVFDRDTGQPLFPIEERPVPQDGVPGEQLSPTQPFPTAPPPLVKQGVTPDDAFGYTAIDRSGCRKAIAAGRYGGYYMPPSREGTIMFPGMGVNNWGGGAWDPERKLLVVPANRAATMIRLLPVAEVDPEVLKNPMAGLMGIPGRIAGTDYVQQFKPLLSPMFSPCTPPPWGELAAVDLAAGTIKWRRTLGVLDKLMRMPIPIAWGTPTGGGPIATAGGVTFIGATMDERLRAFDTETGEQLWETFTPTSNMATPMTYLVNGRQYVVIASGGHMWQYSTKIGDWIVAYALP